MVKVSIITVVFNASKTIADTIQSVLEQTYCNIEYIVVDGLSTDGTIDVVRSFGDAVSVFVSEKDNGLYDAINKGIGLATGDVIGLLHADDILDNPGTIGLIVETLNQYGADSAYGDLLYVKQDNTSKVFRNWKAGSFTKRSFLYGWMPPHPTFYVRKTCLEKYGFYNTHFKTAADYELMLRLLYKYQVSTVYIPETLVRMRVGGKSNASISNRLKANQEDYLAWQVNNLKPFFLTRYLKPLRKIFQFIR
ncbi:glycosyltransferase family 2 protein [Pontibacter sp. SGAir0037]|uniref:glycosyltransferase family 2 protein n=1 Tax=Pontibacter sp. SGAir0037 TaxID=2571030 RepID=UPI0010CD5B7F|nr:glycosyltransferase family 2 protein [Pontibacter sp. SGAir0037]QCR22157.1 glycosyl transferase [Pontibacter sp. SGAir0037]